MKTGTFTLCVCACVQRVCVCVCVCLSVCACVCRRVQRSQLCSATYNSPASGAVTDGDDRGHLPTISHSVFNRLCRTVNTEYVTPIYCLACHQGQAPECPHVVFMLFHWKPNKIKDLFSQSLCVFLLTVTSFLTFQMFYQKTFCLQMFTKCLVVDFYVLGVYLKLHYTQTIQEALPDHRLCLHNTETSYRIIFSHWFASCFKK